MAPCLHIIPETRGSKSARPPPSLWPASRKQAPAGGPLRPVAPSGPARPGPPLPDGGTRSCPSVWAWGSRAGAWMAVCGAETVGICSPKGQPPTCTSSVGKTVPWALSLCTSAHKASLAGAVPTWVLSAPVGAAGREDSPSRGWIALERRAVVVTAFLSDRRGFTACPGREGRNASTAGRMGGRFPG